ncbi:TonB-dependent siderophore receptor [Neorhizobium sp. NCHU2750]|uniref:TonB-dependent siderophore receptor n=1 Tax=Neorhizobium sp. NCHU2750 TaxID=1825976 RepID=UPI000EB61DDA|nr:iron complex outermembrane recepter protein [Neorhizobium sp. NCHU2750]
MTRKIGQTTVRSTSTALMTVLMMTTAVGVGLTLASSEAFAQARAEATFSVPAGPLSSALTAFGRQAGLQVTYLASVASGKTSQGFSGRSTPDQALSRILAGSGLRFSFANATTVAISGTDSDTTGATGSGQNELQPIVLSTTPSGAQDNETMAAQVSNAATKLDTPLVKTARSVSVITRKELEQRQAQTILEAVGYTAGVTTGQSGFDPRFDELHIRGYEGTYTTDYKDGLQQPYLNFSMFRTEPYSLERVEVVKGPVSVLYGAGSPAGIVNKVSKLADGNEVHEVETMYGTEDRKQVAFDFGGKLADDSDFSYRLVGLARKGETNFDIEDDSYFLQPSLTWQPTDQTKVTIYALAQKTETDGSVSALVDESGKVLDMRAGDPKYDYQKTDQQQVGYQVEHEFNDLLTFRQNVRFSHLSLRTRYLEVGEWDGTILHRYPYAFRENMDVFQTDNQLQWTFDTGPLSHKLLTGLDYMKAGSTFIYGYDFYDPYDPAFDLDISDPHYGVTGPTPGYSNYRQRSRLQQTGLYGMDQIEVDNWNFTVGGRQTWVQQTNGGQNEGDPINDHLSDGAFSYQVSALYAFDNGISPYVSYATSFEPVTNRSLSDTILDPAKGEQVEAGVKYQPPGSDIFLSAAAYHLVEKNKPVLDPADPAGLAYRSLGEVTNNGFELEARATVLDGLDMIAAYTYTHSEITGGDDVGNMSAVTPAHVASLWANYTFAEGSALPGLSAGAGVRYSSSSYTSTENTDKNDARVYFDAALGYNFGAIDKKYNNLVASLNVRNIADERDTICNEGFCYLGQGRNITASLKYRW